MSSPLLMGNITGPTKVTVIILAALALIAIGYVARSWWTVLLSLLPVVISIPVEEEWSLTVLWVPPVAFLVALGVALGKRGRGHHAAGRGS